MNSQSSYSPHIIRVLHTRLCYHASTKNLVKGLEKLMGRLTSEEVVQANNRAMLGNSQPLD